MSWPIFGAVSITRALVANRPSEPRRLAVAVQVPLAFRDRDRLEPDRVGLLVEVEDPQRPGHREAVGQPVAEVGAVDAASVRQGTPSAATSRCSGGTSWKNGCRDQDWTCLTKIRNVVLAAGTGPCPVTQ